MDLGTSDERESGGGGDEVVYCNDMIPYLLSYQAKKLMDSIRDCESAHVVTLTLLRCRNTTLSETG